MQRGHGSYMPTFKNSMVHFPKNEIHFYEVGNQPNPQRAKSCANAVLDEHLAPPSCSLEERSKIREEESLPAGMNSSSHFSRISQRVKFLNPFSTHSAIKTSLSARQVLIPWGVLPAGSHPWQEFCLLLWIFRRR